MILNKFIKILNFAKKINKINPNVTDLNVQNPIIPFIFELVDGICVHNTF